MRVGLVLKLLLIISAVAYLAAAAGMYVFQRDFLYVRDSTQTPPAKADLPDVEERTLQTPDGERIIAWYGKAKPGQPTILYFHGNGGALEIRRERIRKYMNRGRGMFMMAYRGYSGSTGLPSEAANLADAGLAYDALINEGIRPEDIIIYGESLGTGVATVIASEKKARGLVLDSPYTSMLDLASEKYPWLPVSWLLKDRYTTRDRIGNVHIPLFILHGEADEVVPARMGRALYALANEPKDIVTLPGAKHNDHYMFGSFEAINAWIDRLWRGEIKAGSEK
jgi:fermentation-respiration switch protein FrsA (DUF1100 family)